MCRTPVIGIVEKDSRHSPAVFARENACAPKDLKHVTADVEFIEFHRRAPFEGTMVTEILQRAGVAQPKDPSQVDAPRGQRIRFAAKES